MSFTEAIRTCFSKYFTFSGRAARAEYWWFVLFLILGGFVAGVLDGFLFGAADVTGSVTESSVAFSAESTGPVAALFSLLTLIPTLSAGWRRMHDTGRSGLYLLYPAIVAIGIGMAAALAGLSIEDGIAMSDGLLSLVFILAFIVFLISPLLVLWWLTRPSEPGENQYGPNPYEVNP